MKKLSVAVLVAQQDLRALEIPLVKPLGLLSGVLSCVSEGGEAPVLMAKGACEAIIDCARTAETSEVADELRRIGNALSPAVARLL